MIIDRSVSILRNSHVSLSSMPRSVFYMLCTMILLMITNAQAGTLVNFDLFANDEKLDLENDLVLEATQQLATFNHGLNQLELEEESRQLTSPNGTIAQLINRIPCSCKKGVCRCCGGFLSVIGLNPCAEVLYRPEEFSFELKMRVNDMVWFRRKVSGQNPPPLCFRPPRFSFARACVQFHDIWFLGRNMHVCMFINGSFQGFNLFEREFDCLMFGDKGVKIVKPEEGYPVRPDDFEIDEGDDEFEEYDENVIR